MLRSKSISSSSPSPSSVSRSRSKSMSSSPSPPSNSSPSSVSSSVRSRSNSSFSSSSSFNLFFEPVNDSFTISSISELIVRVSISFALDLKAASICCASRRASSIIDFFALAIFIYYFL